MKAIRISLAFFILFIFLLNSCVVYTPTVVYTFSSMKTERNKIMRKNPRVTAVGVIRDWTNSDDKYIAVELKLEDDKTLFLPLVDYRKKPGKEPFYVSRVGNYAFATVVHFVNKETNQSELQLRTNDRYKLSEFSAMVGIQINTMSDIIKYYDDINAFVEFLPMVNEDNYQEIFEEGILVDGDFRENKTYFITTYRVKTIWDDEYYGIGVINGEVQKRRPDYENNEHFMGYRLLPD